MLDKIPSPVIDLLRRGEAAFLLVRYGYPISGSRLAVLASRGGGPPVHYFGRWPLYDRNELLTWAQSRISPDSIRRRKQPS